MKLFLVLFGLLFCWHNSFAGKLQDSTRKAIVSGPQYINGLDSFYKFLGANLVYPKTSIQSGVYGIVYLTFCVETDSSISNIRSKTKTTRKFKRKMQTLVDEAIRVFKLTNKKWAPGTTNGKITRLLQNTCRFHIGRLNKF